MRSNTGRRWERAVAGKIKQGRGGEEARKRGSTDAGQSETIKANTWPAGGVKICVEEGQEVDEEDLLSRNVNIDGEG